MYHKAVPLCFKFFIFPIKDRYKVPGGSLVGDIPSNKWDKQGYPAYKQAYSLLTKWDDPPSRAHKRSALV